MIQLFYHPIVLHAIKLNQGLVNAGPGLSRKTRRSLQWLRRQRAEQ